MGDGSWNLLAIANKATAAAAAAAAALWAGLDVHSGENWSWTPLPPDGNAEVKIKNLLFFFLARAFNIFCSGMG